MKCYRWKCLLICVVIMALLTGCNAIGLDVETQLMPPENGGEQEAIRTALDEYISTHTQAGQNTEYTLKYPSGGRYLSAFIMLDRIEEHTVYSGYTKTEPSPSADAPKAALAFYRRNDENALVHINLLQCGKDGSWRSIADVEGKGESVNQVEFGDLNNDGVPELLVGWPLYNTKDSRLAVYDMDDGLAPRQFSGTYTDLVVADVTADGADDLLLLSIANGVKMVTAQLFSFRSNNEIISGVTMLDSGIVRFGDHITTSLFSGNSNGVYIDCYKEQDAMITELICWQDNKLLAPLCDQTTMLNTETSREVPLASRDIDGDGIVEWPITTRMPGFETTDPQTTLWYAEWRSYSFYSDYINKEFFSIIPGEEGYMLRLRNEWNYWPMAYNPSTHVLTLYRNTMGDAVFRIGTFPIAEKDKLPEGYMLLEERRDVCYAVIIEGEDEVISVEEIRYLFNVLGEEKE